MSIHNAEEFIKSLVDGSLDTLLARFNTLLARLDTLLASLNTVQTCYYVNQIRRRRHTHISSCRGSRSKSTDLINGALSFGAHGTRIVMVAIDRRGRGLVTAMGPVDEERSGLGNRSETE